MKTTVDFYNQDFNSSLFPMETSRFLIQNGHQKIREHIKRCLSAKDEDKAYQFLGQTRANASKTKGHLRRTVKLDPVSEYYLYDVIFRNKTKFRKPFKDDKKHFGYRFQDGAPLVASASYSGYKKAIVAYRENYKYSLSFDVASYFNGVYQHDLVAWFANLGASEGDVIALGTFLRQGNSGRSIDCLPQGIYPAKMVGNDFLRFVEQHHGLKSDAIVRFMDDFVMFSDREDALYEDFYLIQKLLGQKGLSINPSKTKTGDTGSVSVEKEVDEIKDSLLAKRHKASMLAYFDDFEAALDETQLTEEETEYIRELLKGEHLEEEDAELALSLFRDNVEEIQPILGELAVGFPHLAKNIWSFSKNIKNVDFLAELFSKVADSERLQEYQLFWFAWILQDFLMDTEFAPEIIDKLYNHKNSSIISKSKVLEIADNRYGLVEMRDEHLVAGRSDWLAWSSAVGHRKLLPVSRNHKLEYFANSSPMNHLIKTILV